MSDFKELIPPFLKKKLDYLKSKYGETSWQYKSLALQYVYNEKEDIPETVLVNIKHYEAGCNISALHGVERLYRRHVVIEPTLACIAHCRYCLRSNYDPFTLDENSIFEIAKYCGSDRDINEVLITGGDSFVAPHKVHLLLQLFRRYAPNIKIVRLATRFLTQDPTKIGDDILSLFKYKDFVFELATQINSPIEFFPETIIAINKIQDLGVRIYSQNVLLKGVNDNIEILEELYDTIRWHAMESHYLFHAIPMRGTAHLRTSVDRGLQLAKKLSTEGKISGRAKPMYAAMTDVGKVTFYDGTIIERRGKHILLQTYYSHEDRIKWNPAWIKPSSAVIDENGNYKVWYLDGEIDA